MKKNPNIILFITHDQGQFLGCYNTPQTPNTLNTPNLDKIANDGIRFTNHFSTAPQCSPSRGSIQTSLYPHQNGLMGLTNRGWNLPATNKTLPMYLRALGYTTHLVGLQHETNSPENLGYDTLGKRGKYFKHVTNKLDSQFLDFLEYHKNDTKPFYANFGTFEVHRPFSLFGTPVSPSEVVIPPFLPDNEMIRKDLSEFYGAIHRTDETIGKIRNYMEDIGLIENTLFIYTTDHGSAFPRSKCTLYDPGIKTVLLMHLPSSELFSGGKVFDLSISNIDILPTLIEVAEGTPPKNIEGNSIIPFLRNEVLEGRKEIYAEKTYHELYDPIRCIRTGKYKYIYNFEKLDSLYQIPIDILMDYSGQYMKDFINEPRPTEELYDLRTDASELNNLAYSSEYNNIREDLKGKLFEWLKNTYDPILQGKIPKQESATFDY